MLSANNRKHLHSAGKVGIFGFFVKTPLAYELIISIEYMTIPFVWHSSSETCLRHANTNRVIGETSSTCNISIEIVRKTFRLQCHNGFVFILNEDF